MTTKDITPKDSIEEFAKTIDVKDIHTEFYINMKINQQNFNQAYSSMLRNRIFYFQTNSGSTDKTEDNLSGENGFFSSMNKDQEKELRETFISALINRANEKECINFSNQFNQYNSIIKSLKYDDMIELWKRYLKVKSSTSRTIDDQDQQKLIKAFNVF